MRWVKHYCRSSQDPFIRRLIDQFGLEGYGRFWRIIETIGEQLGTKREPMVTLPWSDWLKLLSANTRGMRKFLGFLVESGKIRMVSGDEFTVGLPQVSERFAKPTANSEQTYAKPSGNMLTIAYPNILKYQDEYYQKSRPTPDSVGKKSVPRSIEERSKKKDSSALKKQEQKSSATAPASLAFSGAKLKITTPQDAGFSRAFPWVDRPAEYRKMDSWLVANPERQISRFGAFAHHWFSRIPAPSTTQPAAPSAPPLETWTCAECHHQQQSAKGFLRVCEKCGAPA